MTYTDDQTVPGFLGPAPGTRWAASLAAAPGPDAFFATALADGRRYRSLGPGYALALRASAGLSVGPDPQRFYAAGVQNWVNPSLGSLPVESPDDFVFATPVLPLRGFGFNEAAGDRFALVNVEARVPLLAALAARPDPAPAALQHPDDRLRRRRRDRARRRRPLADGPVDDDDDPARPRSRRVLDDVLLGAGVGLRTLVLGYPVRLDWGWPVRRPRVRGARVYFSVGLDF